MFLPASHTNSQRTLLSHPQSPLMDQHNFHILAHSKHALDASKHDFNACWKFLARTIEWLARSSYELGTSSNFTYTLPISGPSVWRHLPMDYDHINIHYHALNACWNLLARTIKWLAGGSYELGSRQKFTHM